MKIVKGKYQNGIVKIEEKVDVEGEQDVYVLFPEVRVKYFDFAELMKAKGIISIGGDAVKDCEDLYNE